MLSSLWETGESRARQKMFQVGSKAGLTSSSSSGRRRPAPLPDAVPGIVRGKHADDQRVDSVGPRDRQVCAPAPSPFGNRCDAMCSAVEGGDETRPAPLLLNFPIHRPGAWSLWVAERERSMVLTGVHRRRGGGAPPRDPPGWYGPPIIGVSPCAPMIACQKPALSDTAGAPLQNSMFGVGKTEKTLDDHIKTLSEGGLFWRKMSSGEPLSCAKVWGSPVQQGALIHTSGGSLIHTFGGISSWGSPCHGRFWRVQSSGYSCRLL